jgi:uncharacterized protein (DUF305 family)
MNMKQNTMLIAVIALLIGGIGGYIIADRGDYGMESMDHSMMMFDGSNQDMDDMPMDGRMGMDHSAMMVSSEREFLTGMIPHHQEAVDTAKEVIERGGSTPEIKALAENIIIAQELEIAEMKQWYLAWYGEEYVADDSYQPMMRELAGLSGAELDQRFLEDMVMHHMGAIMMARSVQSYIEHQEIEVLSQAIVETQSVEIELMQALLQNL